MMTFIRRNKFPLLVFLISFIFAVSSYEPGTILSGWDTLHPEFNLPEYLSRIFFGVWQQHQGVGALATQSHPAELTRMLVYIPLVILLPMNAVRYSYFFITLVAGALGAYYFARSVLFKDDSLGNEVASLGTSLFYLLNLAVLQQYYVPFEMFATHFATLPWLFLFTKKALHSEKYGLLGFSIITFMSTSISHTATLWYAFMATYGLFLIVYCALSKNKQIIKRSALLIVLSLVINAFWLLPNVYFVLTEGNNISLSKIHSLFTEEAFAQNEAFGTVPDLLIFKNFLFNWGEYVGNNQFGPLLNEWSAHLTLPFVAAIGYIFSFISLAGVVYSVKKRDKISIALISILLFSSFFWLNDNPPFGFLFNFFQNTIPFFKEAVRFPFTKFSIILVFASSIYFGWGIIWIEKLSHKIRVKRLAPYVIFVVMLFSFSYYMFPALNGNLISPSMKVHIPQQYFDMFKWFEAQPQGRIAELPINSFWGWQYYSWGYQGAGFLWFGLKQPILDREFDRWSQANEGYYWEMAQAVYTKDPKLLSAVLKKYDVKYVMVDKNVIAPGPGNDGTVLFYPQIKALLKLEPNVKLAKTFGNIEVYNVSTIVDESNFSYLLDDPSSIGPSYTMAFQDNAYLKYGDYITDKNPSIYFPFRTVSDNQNHFLPNTDFTQDGLNISFDSKSASLFYPDTQTSENYIPADVLIKKDGDTLQTYIYPKPPLNTPSNPAPIIVVNPYPQDGKAVININGTSNFMIDGAFEEGTLFLGRVILNTKKTNSVNIYPQKEDLSISPDFSNLNFSLDSCAQFKANPAFGLSSAKGNSFSVFVRNTQACMTIPLTNIFPDFSDIVKSGSEDLLNVSFNFQGKGSPNLCITEINSGTCLYYFSKNLNELGASQQEFSQNLGISSENIKNLAVKVFMDPQIEGQVSNFNYFNMSFALTGSDFSTTINPKDIQGSIALGGTTDKKEAITVPFSGNGQLSRDITQIPKTEGDCSTLTPRGSTPTKKDIVLSQSSQYIRYSSDEGSFCDHFSYQNLPQDQGYLIKVVSRNIKGLPIRMCVTNSISKRCDIYTHLAKSTDFTSETFVLPPMKEGSGFDININNFAVKRIPSVNDLKSIEVIPLPYNYLTGIRSGNSKLNSTRQNLSKVTHLNQSLYFADINGVSASNKVLVLSQGFNRGWAAYSVGSSNILTQVFPFFFGKNLKEHVLVNNWANGWKLSGSEKGVIMVYLPQYLEYIGFIMLLVLTGYYARKHFKS